MIIGLVYGGSSIEYVYDMKVLKEIEKILFHYNIQSVRINLNDLSESLLHSLFSISLLFFINSNCKDISQRNFFFEYIMKNKIEFVGQQDEVFKIARNKHLTNKILSVAGLNVPKSFLFKHKEHLKNHLAFPVIVKDNFGSSSENLDICLDEISFVFFSNHISKKCKSVLVEEYIEGIEITCPFVKLCGKNLVLTPIEIIYNGYIYDYKIKNKTFKNKLRTPPNLNKDILREIDEIVLTANRLIGCDYYSRLDLKVMKDSVYVIEINSEPVLSKNDFLARSAKHMGLSYGKFIVGLLANSSQFVQYAKTENRGLHNFILSIERKIAKIQLVKSPT